MIQQKANRNPVRERITILMVLFFCVFISVAEYVNIDKDGPSGTEKQEAGENSLPDNQTFLDVAVDAVVPFVVGAVGHTFHLIYEIPGFDSKVFSSEFPGLIHNNHFFEILQEKIISTNAP